MLHDVRTCCVAFDCRQILTQDFVKISEVVTIWLLAYNIAVVGHAHLMFLEWNLNRDGEWAKSRCIHWHNSEQALMIIPCQINRILKTSSSTTSKIHKAAKQRRIFKRLSSAMGGNDEHMPELAIYTELATCQRWQSWYGLTSLVECDHNNSQRMPTIWHDVATKCCDCLTKT